MNKYDALSEYIGKELVYKELCKLVDEEIKSGKAKELHLKQLCRYMELNRHNGKIMISRIYDENEIEIAEHRGKYTTYIENILIEHLSKFNQTQVTMTYREILELLYMVNQEYFKARNKQNSYVNAFEFKPSPLDNIDAHEVIVQNLSLFFNISYRLLKEIVDNAIKSMKNRSLIMCAQSFRLSKSEYNIATGNYITKTHDCTDEEVKRLLEIRYGVLKEFNLKNLSDVIFLSPIDRKVFFTKVAEQIEKEFGYDTYAHTLVFTLGTKGLKAECKKIRSAQKLNQNIQQKLLTSKEMKYVNEILKPQLIDTFIDLN